ncbi:MAG: heme lyase CcmF/NrfE family subunit [Casimicrobiaceae bacterium]|nr:heme lyase CcmF/NrfE family subunit [Casimicrobiaceae bacterium]MDW8312938.1 heme lyase CcmF/NrfE family subunit [Burkholderiales bacterium]
MIPELGNLSLILAFFVTLTVAVFGAGVNLRRGVALIEFARQGTLIVFALIAFAFGALMTAFVQGDFSVQNVAQNSNSLLPWYYRVTATWGSHEGSMLLWLLMLAGWSAAVAIFSRQLPDVLVTRVLVVLAGITSVFIAFTVLTSNPFERILPAPPDGRDLNPLLQDPGMIFHPPLLYMGYVGFAVVFAFAIAALWGGRLDSTWARWSRPWTIVAWIFLTLGIALGSFWAYYELGWGGWWFWDPVENASFMPWLVGTALIHSLAVTEKRGAFKAWTVLLAIAAFSLSLLGTFLVRSGVLTSVHAFATDPQRGVFILAFLVAIIGGSLTLYALRAPAVHEGGRFGLLSRESFLLGNNLLLVVATASVLLGTLYPLASEALGWGKVSVGPPYFEIVFVPLMLPLIALMGIGPLARWKDEDAASLRARMLLPAIAAAAAFLLCAVIPARFSPLACIGMAFAAWLAAGVLVGYRERLRHAAGLASGLARWRQIPIAYHGMQVAHLGVAAFVFGVTAVKAFEQEHDLAMKPGDTKSIAGYVVRFEGVAEVTGPNYTAKEGRFVLLKNDALDRVLKPQRRFYASQRAQPMTEAAIDREFDRDLYVSLGEELSGGAWTVRVHYKPFVNWIWLGCVIMALGGLLGALDPRYRRAARTARELQSVQAAAAP